MLGRLRRRGRGGAGDSTQPTRPPRSGPPRLAPRQSADSGASATPSPADVPRRGAPAFDPDAHRRVEGLRPFGGVDAGRPDGPVTSDARLVVAANLKAGDVVYMGIKDGVTRVPVVRVIHGVVESHPLMTTFQTQEGRWRVPTMSLHTVLTKRGEDTLGGSGMVEPLRRAPDGPRPTAAFQDEVPIHGDREDGVAT